MVVRCVLQIGAVCASICRFSDVGRSYLNSWKIVLRPWDPLIHGRPPEHHTHAKPRWITSLSRAVVYGKRFPVFFWFVLFVLSVCLFFCYCAFVFHHFFFFYFILFSVIYLFIIVLFFSQWTRMNYYAHYSEIMRTRGHDASVYNAWQERATNAGFASS